MVVAFHRLSGSGLVVTVALDTPRDERAYEDLVAELLVRFRILAMSSHPLLAQPAFSGPDNCLAVVRWSHGAAGL
jgi:hypothetical protein